MVNRYMTSQGTQVSIQDAQKMSAMSPQSIASICKLIALTKEKINRQAMTNLLTWQFMAYKIQ